MKNPRNIPQVGGKIYIVVLVIVIAATRLQNSDQMATLASWLLVTGIVVLAIGRKSRNNESMIGEGTL